MQFISIQRIKQALIGIGLLTVLGVITLVGTSAYLWWDTRATDVGTDFDDDLETSLDIDPDDASETTGEPAAGT